MALAKIMMTVEIADDATTGPDYGNNKVMPGFLTEYLVGAGEHLFGSVRGVTVVEAETAS